VPQRPGAAATGRADNNNRAAAFGEDHMQRIAWVQTSALTALVEK
jgi:hypothetical protein